MGKMHKRLQKQQQKRARKWLAQGLERDSSPDPANTPSPLASRPTKRDQRGGRNPGSIAKLDSAHWSIGDQGHSRPAGPRKMGKVMAGSPSAYPSPMSRFRDKASKGWKQRFPGSACSNEK